MFGELCFIREYLTLTPGAVALLSLSLSFRVLVRYVPILLIFTTATVAFDPLSVSLSLRKIGSSFAKGPRLAREPPAHTVGALDVRDRFDAEKQLPQRDREAGNSRGNLSDSVDTIIAVHRHRTHFDVPTNTR